MNEIEAKVLEAIDGAAQLLPANELEEMKQLVRAGEPGVALENLATQLFEYDAAATPALIDLIESVGTTMGINSKYWMRLRGPQP
jgi:hypothetical protein